MSTTEDRIRISVEDPRGLLKGPWALGSGEAGEYEVSTGREEAGGDYVAVSGPLTKSDMTIERKYNALRDDQILAACEQGETFAGASITKVYLDGSYNPIPGLRRVSSGLVLASYQGPAADADSSERAMLQLTFKRI